MMRPLTERERQVLQLIVDGRTNGETRVPRLSITTVQRHVTNLGREIDA